MGKNRRGKGKGKFPQGMRPPHPAEEYRYRPPLPSGFRGPPPVRPMGPAGPRFPAHPFDLKAQPRVMRDDRQFVYDDSGFFPFDDCRAPRFSHRPDFDDRSASQRFYHPDRMHRPAGFADGPPDFYPPEFNDRPAFPRMHPEYEPVDFYVPRQTDYIPQTDGNHAFRNRGGFAGHPKDFQGPGPVPPQPPIFNAPGMPPPRKPCPPPPQKKKEPAKSELNKSEPSNTVQSTTPNAPRGRSLGVISFIGNACGFIERDDLKKFSFAFNAFYGIKAHLVPGVKVHFTVVKNLGKEVATDVKVAPGGTEDIDSTVYEGVVISTLADGNTNEAYPGSVRAIISVDPIKLSFGKTDTSVTLLLYDRVEFQLMTNVLTKEQRATNIKPKIPDTFQLTKETRKMGVIVEKTNETLTIKTEKDENLKASAADRLSEDELNVEDEVEFTVMSGNETKKAIRLKKLPVGTVTSNQDKGNKNNSEKNTTAASPSKDKWKPVTSEAGSQESVVSSEKHEGTIIKTTSRSSPPPEEEDKQNPALGLLNTVVEGTDKKLSFRSADVITKATMMVGDKVQFNISTNSVTKEECAVNLVILPASFQTNSEEQRKNGHVVKLNENSGFIKTQQHPQLFFNMSEVMEETKLSLFEKVEYTIVPNKEAPGGNQAVRIRRLNMILTSASKLEATGVKEKKKMSIKLLQETKDKLKEEVKTEESDSTKAKPITGTDKVPPFETSIGELKKKSEDRQKTAKSKNSREQSRDRETSRRKRSRSRSRESIRCRRSRSGSQSRDRYGRVHRSSSRERRDSRYRRSHSREHSERHRRSQSRSRETSGRSDRKRSYSPDYRDDRYKKHCTSKDSSNRNKEESLEGNVDDEILKKRKELMELNEMIARRKAIVAMEQNSKRFEIEGEGQHGVKTFDYQHCENLWTPEAKPVKSILKKQPEFHDDPPLQASANDESSLFVQSADSERNSALNSNTPIYSTQKMEPQKCLTAGMTQKIPLPHIQDQELQRKKHHLDELSESIARKRALIALEQKSRGFQDTAAMKNKYEMDFDLDEDQFELPKKSFWSSDIKPNIQPKKSILKKRMEPPSFQSDSASFDYDQVQQSQDGSLFAKSSFQSMAAPPLVKHSNPQTVHSDALSLFTKFINESKQSLINKPAIVPKSLAQASNLRSLHDQNPFNLSKGTNIQEAQQRVFSTPPPSESPLTSTSSSDPKRNVTTQMERFLSALNKADSSIVSSLIQEARRDLPLVSKPKAPQPQLDRNIPFMDEIYDPFKEDEDQPSPSIRVTGRSQLETEDPNQDDLLPHERAIQDGSGFSQLVGTKYEGKLPYSQQMETNNWSAQKADWLSEEWKPYTEDRNLHLAKQKVYVDNPDLYGEGSQAIHSYTKDVPDDTSFDKSLARQQSEESNEGKKEDQFEKFQSLLQTIGFHLDTGEVSKLADRTRERLYGKAVKPHNTLSSDINREPSTSRSERGGSSRADSSDTERFRSVSPGHSSKRKVYMSYKDSVKNKEQLEVEDVDLTSIKRTILNVKPKDDTQDPVTPSVEQTMASLASYQSTTEAAGSQYAQNDNATAYLPLQYSYYNNQQNPWSSVYSQYTAYGTYGAPSHPSYSSYHQTVPQNVMSGYSGYATQSVNQYSVTSQYRPIPFDPSVKPSNNIVISTKETIKTQPPVRCLKTIEIVNVKTATDVKVDTDAANQQPMENKVSIAVEEVGKTQVATITEEQKRRLEQFNQRMKLKKEKQMEAMRLRGQKQNSTPGKSTPGEIKNVWICGHSLVFWAEKRANSLEFGGQLGMHPNHVRIWWKGVQGMTWKQLLPLLLQLKDNWPKPDVLIVHLGGNDISTTTPELFLGFVKEDFTSLKSIFPGCLLVWSDILSRQFWRDTVDSNERDIIRMNINDSIHSVMNKLGGSFLTHDNIRPSSGLYRPDGVHLSGKGIDMFNLNLQDFLEKWECVTETKAKSSDPSIQGATS